MSSSKEEDLPKVGVILANVGTPDGTDYASMRRYLAEFLSDHRIVELSRFIWYPILYGIILMTRPQRSGALYKRIWNKELDESPLRTVTRDQAEKLAARLHLSNANVEVSFAMRYGSPSIADVIDELVTRRGCVRLLLFPLYPQYSATTTASVCDKAFEALSTRRLVPALRTVPSYPVECVYIDALAQTIRRHLASLVFVPEVLITTYHGIPAAYAEKGDPYDVECRRTTEALVEKLQLDDVRVIVAFQSRVGPAEWLRPYTDELVIEIARSGVKRVVTVAPGFVADCLETTDEIGHDLAELFTENGGEHFSLVPCLNSSDDGLRVLETITRRELAGWI